MVVDPRGSPPTPRPRQSAYAGITTYSPDGEGGAKEKTLKLPNGGVFFTSAATVTYWQDNAADALAW
ncbi:hypothetical protein [Streptomyces mirabilis]|uniref:hypothetical protein n=1 Tax=Streptomyces mirabilis TaxID=68239 RepID=UPI0033312DA2